MLWPLTSVPHTQHACHWRSRTFQYVASILRHQIQPMSSTNRILPVATPCIPVEEVVLFLTPAAHLSGKTTQPLILSHRYQHRTASTALSAQAAAASSSLPKPKTDQTCTRADSFYSSGQAAWFAFDSRPAKHRATPFNPGCGSAADGHHEGE